MSSVITGGSNDPLEGRAITWEDLVLESHRGKQDHRGSTTTRTLNGHGRCPSCGKMNHPSRRAAKAYARQHSLVGLSAYRCQHSKADTWHLGHLPDSVRRGNAPREIIRTTTLNKNMAAEKRRMAAWRMGQVELASEGK